VRPLGNPPTPKARSTAREPVVSTSTFILALSPSRMMEPSPNCFVMEERASSIFLSRAWATAATAAWAAEPLADFDSADLAGAGAAALDMAGTGLRTGITFEGNRAAGCAQTLTNQVWSITGVRGNGR